MKENNSQFSYLKTIREKGFLTSSYVLFSIYLVLYAVFSLTIIKLQIFPTINRITYFDTAVFWSLTNSINYDILVTLIILCTCIFFIFKRYISIPFIMIILGTSILTILFQRFENFNEVIFLITLPAVISLFIGHKIFGKKFLHEQTKIFPTNFHIEEFLKVFFLVFLIFEFFVIIRWLLNPLFLEISIEHWSWKLNFLDSNLFYAFGLLSKYLIILSILAFATRLFIPKLSSKIYYILSKKNRRDLSYHQSEVAPHQKERKKFFNDKVNKYSAIFDKNYRTLFLVILVAALPSALLPFYAYSTVSSPDVSFLGTDIPGYLKWLESISSSSNYYDEFFYQPFIEIHEGSRPLTLLLMHAISLLGFSYEMVLKYLPVMFGPILVLSAYYATLIMYPKDRRLAVIVSIVTAFSHQIIIGFYAAFYANWLALIVIFFSISFLIKSIREPLPNYRNITLFGIFSILALLVHSYTWSYFVAVLILYLLWSFIIKKRSKQSVKVVVILGIVVLAVIGVDIVKSIPGSSDSFTKDLDFGGSLIGLEEYAERWRNLDKVFTFYLGGFLTNSVIMVLLFIWTLKAKYENDSDRFLLSMLFVSLLPVLFGDFVVQSRIFFNIPLQIPASIIIYRIYLNSKMVFGKPFVFAILFLQFSYALRALANMEFIPI